MNHFPEEFQGTEIPCVRSSRPPDALCPPSLTHTLPSVLQSRRRLHQGAADRHRQWKEDIRRLDGSIDSLGIKLPPLPLLHTYPADLTQGSVEPLTLVPSPVSLAFFSFIDWLVGFCLCVSCWVYLWVFALSPRERTSDAVEVLPPVVNTWQSWKIQPVMVLERELHLGLANGGLCGSAASDEAVDGSSRRGSRVSGGRTRGRELWSVVASAPHHPPLTRRIHSPCRRSTCFLKTPSGQT